MPMIESSQFSLLSLRFAKPIAHLSFSAFWSSQQELSFAFKLAHSLSIRLVNCLIAVERVLTHSCNSAHAKFAAESTPIKSSQSCIISFRMPSFISQVAFRDMTDSIKLRMALLD